MQCPGEEGDRSVSFPRETGQTSPGLGLVLYWSSSEKPLTVCQVTEVISQWGSKPKGLMAVRSSAALNKQDKERHPLKEAFISCQGSWQ